MLKFICLGLVQGLTEFLPVSSSGHLVLLQHIIGMQEFWLINIVVLHLGTVLALLVFFFGDIIRAFKDRRTMINILIVTAVTGLAALIGKDFFESLFSSVRAVAFSLLITGLILISTRKQPGHKRDDRRINTKDALIMGLAQAISIIPGISRSGITISALLFRNIDRESAFKFSFLASIPAITGAFILQAREAGLGFSLVSPNLFAGFIAAFISGLCALYVLKIVLKKARFFYFGYYCLSVSILSLALLR